ncbi:hypothetical protein UFOVP813_40 [uncultured Caudovirales phage]|uniref:Terminase small subunit n=1 Tax=uncultured Caudovirales phage TaxID=2100421 RepID=A0A6J5P2U4_9CAUD|nr:hypothetical protein UFOVP813_40 [uncultured Caudovirales phage]
MPAIKPAKHEAFALLVATNDSAAAAYRELWPKASRARAETAGPELARRSQVKVRIEEHRQARAVRQADKRFLTVEEKRIHCARVFRAHGANLDVDGEDADLIQGVTYTKDGRAVYSMMSKSEAIKLDNDLAVDGAEAGANKALEIIIRKL